MTSRLTGLIAATYTPFTADGSFDAEAVAPMVDRLIDDGINGLYVCGSTGEGMSLTGGERRAVVEAFVSAAADRVPVIAQVGHNSVDEACELAAHAAAAGCSAISATCPSYYSLPEIPTQLDCMARIAAAGSTVPFYYYHIPALTGCATDIVDFVQRGIERIPTLAGLKYSDTRLHEFQTCQELQQGRLDVVWGCDEMLLGALATGARAAIGSTYNIAAPLYREVIDAFNAGDLSEARRLQSLSVRMVRTLGRHPFHSAMKAVLKMVGLSAGECRIPLANLSAKDKSSLRDELDAIGFFEFSRGGAAP